MLNNTFIKYKNSAIIFFKQIDNRLEQSTIKKTCIGLILFISFVSIYILNRLQPIFGDDWNYSLKADGHTRISSLSDIFWHLYEHYFVWGGRIVVHIIAELLLILNEHTANLINSLIFVLFTWAIYYIANQKNPARPSLLIFINLLILFFIPSIGSTILWITGSANYLCGTLIIITFLIPFVRQAFSEKTKDNYFRSFLFLTGGIIAGWTNENMAVALLFILVILLIYYKSTMGKIPQWAIAGLIGSIIGATLMIVAPGNYARMDTVIANKYIDQSIVSIIFSRITGTLSSFFYYCLVPTFIFLITLWMYYTHGNREKKQVLFLAYLFMSGAVVATLAMAASPIFPGRASFGINTFIFIASCILFANLQFNTLLIKRLVYTTAVFGLLLYAVDYFRAYSTMSELNRHLEARMENISNQKRNGIADIVLNDRISPENRFLHYYELTPDSTDWHNRMFSGYHDLKTIVVK